MTQMHATSDCILYYYQKERGRVSLFDPSGSDEDMPKAPHFVLTVENPRESLTHAFQELSSFLKKIDGATGAILLGKDLEVTPAAEEEGRALLKQNDRIVAICQSPDDSLISGVSNYFFSRQKIRQEKAYLDGLQTAFATNFRPFTP